MTVPHRRIKRERGADLEVLTRGCPRNCKRRVFVTKPLGFCSPGKATKIVSREPGDLPSTVVMREHVGRGVQTGSRTKDPRIFGETSIAVTCQLACRPRCFRVFNHRCYTTWSSAWVLLCCHTQRSRSQRTVVLHCGTCSR
jgi:hypothetical protein